MSGKMQRKKRSNLKTATGFTLANLNDKLNNLNTKALRLKKKSRNYLIKNEKRMAIGIFIEGQSLYVVSLSRKNNHMHLVDAETYELSNRLEKTFIPEKAPEVGDLLSEDNGGLDFSTDNTQPTLVITDNKNGNNGKNETVFRKILEKYAHHKCQIGISLAEPQIHFSYYDGDWSQDDLAPKQKVIEELTQVRTDARIIKPDDLYLIKMADRRMMAIIRNTELDVINLLKRVQPAILKRLAFVEIAETSLVNLINANYDFDEDDLIVVIYVGVEISRLVFLIGKEICNISYILADSHTSDNIAGAIYSRLLLEQDNLHLPKMDRIILSGEAHAVGLHNFLNEHLPKGIEVEYLKFENLKIFGIDSLMSRFAIAGGSALRALDDEENNSLYDIDLTPHTIKESQKFQLGVLGWILLFVVPLFTFFTTIRYGQQNRDLARMEMRLSIAKEQLDHLEDVDMRLNVFKRQLDSYTKIESVADSLIHGGHSWGDLLAKLGKTVNSVRGLWITDVDQEPKGQVLVRGHATARSKILKFADLLGNATIVRVDVQEIREKKLFSFAVEFPLLRIKN